MANLDIQLRASTAAMDAGFSAAAKTVEAFEKNAVAQSEASVAARNAIYADMHKRQQAAYEASYNGYRDNLKKQEQAAADHAKKQEQIAKDAAKAAEQAEKDKAKAIEQAAKDAAKAAEEAQKNKAKVAEDAAKKHEAYKDKYGGRLDGKVVDINTLGEADRKRAIEGRVKYEESMQAQTFAGSKAALKKEQEAVEQAEEKKKAARAATMKEFGGRLNGKEVDIRDLGEADRKKAIEGRTKYEEQQQAKTFAGGKALQDKAAKDADAKTKAQKATADKAVKDQEAKASEQKAKFNANVSGIASAASGAISTVSSGSLSGIVSGIGGAAAKAATMIGGPVAGAVVGAAAEIVEKVGAKIGEAMHKMAALATSARSLGTTIQGLGQLDFASKVLGGGDMAATLDRFEDFRERAHKGQVDKTLLQNLRMTGQELAAIQDPADAYLLTIGRIEKSGLHVASKKAMARDAGVDFTHVQAGEAAMREQMAKGGTLGVGDPGAAMAAKEAAQAWRQLDATFEALWANVAAALAPVIKDISVWLADFGVKFGKVFGEGVRLWVEYEKTVFKVAGAIWNFHEAGLKAIASFLGMSDAINGGMPTWEQFKTGALTALFTIQFAVDHWSDAVKIGMDAARLYVEKFKNELVHAFTVVVPAAVVGLGEGLIKAGGSLTKAWAALTTGNVGAFASALKDGVGKAFDGVEERVKNTPKRIATNAEKELERKLKNSQKPWKDFLKDKFDEYNKAPDPEKPPGGTRSPQLFQKTAAMEFGSKEAFSTIYAKGIAGQDDKNNALKVAQSQLAESRKQTALYEKMFEAMKNAGKIKTDGSV